jgi:uncharacterized protein (DUF2164 family)
MKFSKEEKERMVAKLRKYFADELDYEIGSFDTEFLIDFISEELGGYFYNKGLFDAEVVINQQVANISDALMELEKSVS